MRHLGGGKAVRGAGGQGAGAGGGRGEGVPQAPAAPVPLVGCVNVGVVAGGWTNVVFWTELRVWREGPGGHGVGGVVRRGHHGGRGHGQRPVVQEARPQLSLRAEVGVARLRSGHEAVQRVVGVHGRAQLVGVVDFVDLLKTLVQVFCVQCWRSDPWQHLLEGLGPGGVRGGLENLQLVPDLLNTKLDVAES